MEHTLSCQERAAHGPSFLDVARLVWWHMWPVMLIIAAACAGCAATAISDLSSMTPQFPNYGSVCRNLLLLPCRVLHYFLQFYVMSLVMALVLLAFAVVPPTICFAMFAAAFPVLCKLHVGHVQDSMLVCLPLPSGEVVGLNAYMWPPYAAFFLKGLMEIFSSRWQNPEAKIKWGESDTPFRVVDVWLIFQVWDLYLDLAAFVTMFGSVHPGFQICWALTCIPSAALVVAVAMCPLSEQRMWQYRRLQVLLEDIPQLLLASCGLFSRTLAPDMNQYLYPPWEAFFLFWFI